MRLLAYTALTTSALLTACGSGAPKTQAEMLLGEWEQVEAISITQDGQSVMISDGEVEYDADGTSEGEATMTIDSMPDDINSYRMVADSTYVLTDGVLSETLVSGTVTPINSTEQSDQIAQMIQAGMMQAPASSSTIVSLTKDTLVIRENESGAEITYKRD